MPQSWIPAEASQSDEKDLSQFFSSLTGSLSPKQSAGTCVCVHVRILCSTLVVLVCVYMYVHYVAPWLSWCVCTCTYIM